MARAAGSLPDPMISLGLNGERYPGKLLGEDPMVMGTVMLNQTIPFPGKRGLRRDAASAEAEASRVDWTRMRRQMAADVRSMYADLYAMDAMAAALDGSQTALDLVQSSASARASTGTGMQADLIEVQLQRSRLSEQREDLEVERTAMAARLNAMLDRPAGIAIRTAEPPAFPAGGESRVDSTTEENPTAVEKSAESVAAAENAVQNAPEVEYRRRNVEVERLKLQIARRESWPDLTAGVEYGWRNGLPPMVTASLGFEVPIWKGAKQDSETRAATHELEMARQDLRMAEADARGEVERLRTTRDAAARQVDRYRLEIVPRSALLLESVRTSYAAGTGKTIRDIVEAVRMDLEARSGMARRRADLYKAEVALATLAGTDPLVSREGESR